jgi:hypothetical protein
MRRPVVNWDSSDVPLILPAQAFVTQSGPSPDSRLALSSWSSLRSSQALSSNGAGKPGFWCWQKSRDLRNWTSRSVRCVAAMFPESEVDRTRRGHRESGAHDRRGYSESPHWRMSERLTAISPSQMRGSHQRGHLDRDCAAFRDKVRIVRGKQDHLLTRCLL